MRLIIKRLSVALRCYAAAAASATTTFNSKNFTTTIRRIKFQPSVRALEGRLSDSPWSATQLRGARFSGSDVRFCNLLSNSIMRFLPFIFSRKNYSCIRGAILQYRYYLYCSSFYSILL